MNRAERARSRRRPASGFARRRQVSVTACARVVYIGFSVASSPDGTPRLLRGGRSKPKSRQLAARTATAVARHVLLTSGPLPVSPRCDPCLSPGVGSASALSCASAWLTDGRQLLHCQLVYVPNYGLGRTPTAPTAWELLPSPSSVRGSRSSRGHGLVRYSTPPSAAWMVQSPARVREGYCLQGAECNATRREVNGDVRAGADDRSRPAGSSAAWCGRRGFWQPRIRLDKCWCDW